MTAEPQSVEAIQAALKSLLDNKAGWERMGQCARSAYEQDFSAQVNYRKLDDVLRDLNRDYT